MGRKRTVNLKLPPHMHQKGGSYYFVQMVCGKRKWIPLGNDLPLARIKWAELSNRADELPGKNEHEIDGSIVTFAMATARFRRDVLPGKAAKTQEEYSRQLTRLEKVFGQMPLNMITPLDVRQYMDTRTAKVAANREKSVLSTVFNHARGWGYTNAANPVAGIKGNRETGRQRYIEDTELLAVLEKACRPLRDAIELAYCTGQRPSDVLGLKRTDIRDGALWIRQRKTGTALRIEISGQLFDVLNRITAEQALTSYGKVRSLYLVQNEQGQALGKSALRYRFNRACKAAGIEDFQFRDLRGKAATDTEEILGLGHTRKLLGHSSEKMTEHYVKARAGYRIAPTPHRLIDKKK